MNNKIKIIKIQIENFKNVINGEIELPSYKSHSFNKSDVLGIYGQNGSGKTAIVEAFDLLYRLLHGETLPKETHRLIFKDSQTANLHYTFLIEKDGQSFECLYSVQLSKQLNHILDNLKTEDEVGRIKTYISKEEIKYKLLTKGSRPKVAISYLRQLDSYSVEPKSLYNQIKSDKNDSFVSYKVNAQLAYKEHTSFLFRSEGLELLKEIMDDTVFNLIELLKFKYANNLFVMTNQESSLILANMLFPIRMPHNTSQDTRKDYSLIFFNIKEPQVISVDRLTIIKLMFQNISKVLCEIVPGLTVEVIELGNQTLPNGTLGVRVELVSIRNGNAIPFICESEGIKKLIAILGYLIAMYNDENVCVVLDELDAGIFEFLLGEIVKILHDTGKGQLIFTSHNLRLLEVLDKENLVFTSTNPDERYINLRGIKETNNIRDVYIRAIQLGHDGAAVYKSTDRYDIMDAFEEVGELTYEK